MDFSSQASETLSAATPVAATPKAAPKSVAQGDGFELPPLWKKVLEGAGNFAETGVEFVSDVASEVVETTPEVVENLKERAGIVSDAVSDFGSSEYRFFAANLFNSGGNLTQDDLNETDIATLAKAVKKAKSEGRTSLDYGDFGTSESEVLKSGPLAGLFNPELRLARTLGGLNFTEEDGDAVIRNTYNFNKGPKRVAYYEAKKNGDHLRALEILSQAVTNPVEAASIIGYARQEELREKGEPFESEMIINLGKL
jgi:hypothetical protein